MCKTSRTISRLAATIFLLSALGVAQSPFLSKESLEKEFKDKVFFLRDFSQSSKIRIDADGMGNNKGGPWMSGLIEIKKVDVRAGELVFSGNRLMLIHSSPTKGFNAGRTGQKVQVTVTGDLERLGWRQYFITDMRQLGPLVPSPYKSLVEGTCEPSKQPDESQKGQVVAEENGVKIYRVGANVTAPRTKYAPDPEYSEVARARKFQGVTILQVTVGPNGKPENIQICAPLGMGLDEAALNAVRQWRFEPAKRDGVPVAVRINVEINFNLY
jgi:TonB family protein